MGKFSQAFALLCYKTMNDIKLSKVQKYQRTKRGLTKKIFQNQKVSCKRKNMSIFYESDDFTNWCLSQRKFHKLFENWKANNYQKHLSPSIDRIDNYRGYSFDNIQLMTWEENQTKGYDDMRNGKANTAIKRKAVIQLTTTNEEINRFISRSEASRKTGINCRHMGECCAGLLKTAGGFKWINF
jgi:hypothetical protein